MAGQQKPVNADASFSMLHWPDGEYGTWGIRANWVIIDGRPECVGLQLWRGADQAYDSPLAYVPIRGEDLRPITATGVAELPVATIIDKLRDAARDHWRRNSAQRQALLPPDDPRAEPFTAFEEPERRRPGAPRRYDGDHFVQVARIYLDAWRDGSPHPTEAVAAHFGVGRTAAAKWIARCRSDELQLLTPATPGKAGAEPGPRLGNLTPTKHPRGKR